MSSNILDYLKSAGPRLLGSREAAQLLGCHQETVYKLLKQGHLSHTRVGGRVKFSAAQLIAYLEPRTVPVVRPLPAQQPSTRSGGRIS